MKDICVIPASEMTRCPKIIQKPSPKVRQMWSLKPHLDLDMDKAEWEHLVKNLKNHLFQVFLLYRAKSNLLELYNHYIITLKYLTLHHIQIHIRLCSMFDRIQIFGSHNVKTKKQVLLRSRKKAYPRIQSNLEDYCLQKKITLKIFFRIKHILWVEPVSTR